MENRDNVKEFTFTWTIENFSSCDKKVEDCLKSPIFVAENLDKSKWALKLYPKGHNVEFENYITCCLQNIEIGTENIQLDLEIVILSNGNHILAHLNGNHTFKKNNSFDFQNILKIEEIDSMPIWFQDTLTVVCTMKKTETRKPEYRCTARTKIGVDRISFRWNLRHFICLYSAENKRLNFSDECPMEILFTISEDDILIEIFRISGDINLTRFLKCKLTFLNVEGEERYSKIASHLFDSRSEMFKFPTFITKTQLESECLKNGIFVLLCEFSVSNGKKFEEIETCEHGKSIYTEPAINIIPTSTLSSDFGNMFDSGKYTDYEIEVDEHLFPVHKAVLAARSRYFAIIFEMDMVENQTGVFKITDMEVGVFAYFLEFIYTDRLPLISFDFVLPLLQAADRFQVQSLQERCGLLLATNLSDENVCKILSAAFMIEYHSLKINAIAYIKTHAERIFSSPEWDKWVENNSNLKDEILRHSKKLRNLNERNLKTE